MSVSLGFYKTEKATELSSCVCLPETIKTGQQTDWVADTWELEKSEGRKLNFKIPFA